MKNLSLFILVFSWMICFGQNAIDSSEISWITTANWEQILSKARAERKFIFIDCYATWCVPCKKMDKIVYTDKQVAKYFNNHFISIKLQMDTTAKDRDDIREWYEVARKIEMEYKISGYPTLLFLSSDGQLINKELGFKSSNELLTIADNSISKNREMLLTELENYKKGIKNYSRLKDLAEFVKKVLVDDALSKSIANDFINNSDSTELLMITTINFVRDIQANQKLANELAKKYKEKYLDKLTPKELLTPENLNFIWNYTNTVKSSDNFFKYSNYEPRLIDSISGIKGLSKNIVNATITTEELRSKLVVEGKPIFIEPNWDTLKRFIQNKYPKINCEKLILDFQIRYYLVFDQNWKKWVEYKDDRIKKYPPNPNDEGAITLDLNDGGAWYAFGLCNDRQVLSKALKWIEIALRITKMKHPYAYLDTKGNVLYKLGRIDEAIVTERRAVNEVLKEGNRNSNEMARGYEKVIKQMQSREPTYVDQGAIWNEITMPKKAGNINAANEKKRVTFY